MWPAGLNFDTCLRALSAYPVTYVWLRLIFLFFCIPFFNFVKIAYCNEQQGCFMNFMWLQTEKKMLMLEDIWTSESAMGF